MFYASAVGLRPTKKKKKIVPKNEENWYDYDRSIFSIFYSGEIHLARVHDNVVQAPRTTFVIHFQTSAMYSDSKEGTETAADLYLSRECTKEPIFALPNNGSMGKF